MQLWCDKNDIQKYPYKGNMMKRKQIDSKQSISKMMFIYKKSLNRSILLRDFCLSQLYGDYFYVAMCLCLISVVDVMFSQQNNNFLLSIAIYIVGGAIN